MIVEPGSAGALPLAEQPGYPSEMATLDRSRQMEPNSPSRTPATNGLNECDWCQETYGSVLAEL